jgi:hypothetical protein
MIYDSLEILPYKLFMRIVENTSLITLLSTNKDEDVEVLKAIWESLFEEYKEISPEKEEMKLLHLKKEIEYLECKHKGIAVALSALDFDYNQELVDILIGYGYKLSKETYYDDLKRIERESEALLMKAKNIKKRLPKEDANSVSTKVTIDRVFAFYSSVLGYDFEYNEVSVTKVLALKEQVNAKLKSIEEQNERIKSTKPKK